MLLGGGSGGFENARFASTKTSSRKKVDVLHRQNAMFKTYVFLRRNGSLAINFRFLSLKMDMCLFSNNTHAKMSVERGHDHAPRTLDVKTRDYCRDFRFVRVLPYKKGVVSYGFLRTKKTRRIPPRIGPKHS